MTRLDDDKDNDDQKIDNEIEYHFESEHAAYRARDYAIAEHHRKMQEILRQLKMFKNQKVIDKK